MLVVVGCNDSVEVTEFNSLIDFAPIEYDFETYLTFKGRDVYNIPINSSFSEPGLVVHQIDENGKLIHKYVIKDDSISTFKGFQKGDNVSS